MRVLLLMGDWGDGVVIGLGLAFLLLGVPLIVLIATLWGRHIEKQFDRTPPPAPPAKPPPPVQGARLFLGLLVAAMLVLFVALATWVY
jgi:hypothetical protein